MQGNPYGVRLLPSEAAIYRTPDLGSRTYLPRPASHCTERYREGRRHSSFPGGGEEADDAQQSQVRQTELVGR